jgi:hypothetical protein
MVKTYQCLAPQPHSGLASCISNSLAARAKATCGSLGFSAIQTQLTTHIHQTAKVQPAKHRTHLTERPLIASSKKLFCVSGISCTSSEATSLALDSGPLASASARFRASVWGN